MAGALALQSDEILVERVAEGSKDALATLFLRYASLVHNTARKILRKPAEADETAQEVFIFLFREAARFKKCGGSIHSWILRVTYYRAFDRRRSLSTRDFYAHRGLDDPMLTDLQNKADSDFIEEYLKNAMGRESAIRLWQVLSSSQMLTMELHFFHGRTLEEISRCNGQTLRDVRHHYYRGIEKLRRANFSCRTVAEKPSGDSYQVVPLLESEHADDYFIELCALWGTGTLNAAEWHQLSVHLSLCSNCKAIKAQYDCMLATLLPALASWLCSVDDEEAATASCIQKVEGALFRSL